MRRRAASAVLVLAVLGACGTGAPELSLAPEAIRPAGDLPAPTSAPRSTTTRPAPTTSTTTSTTTRPTPPPTSAAPTTVPAPTTTTRPAAPAVADVVASGTVTNVVDGDTVDVDGVGRVRIAIVDTPEVHGGAETCGAEAAAFTEDLVLGRRVLLRRPPGAPRIDPYDRVLAEVVRADDGVSLNVALYAAGLGTLVERYADEDPDLAARLRATAQATPACAPVGSPPTTAPTTAPPTPTGAPGATGPGGAYRNCSEAYANGRHHILRGEPGYGPHLDGDDDGVACESPR